MASTSRARWRRVRGLSGVLRGEVAEKETTDVLAVVFAPHSKKLPVPVRSSFRMVPPVGAVGGEHVFDSRAAAVPRLLLHRRPLLVGIERRGVLAQDDAFALHKEHLAHLKVLLGHPPEIAGC